MAENMMNADHKATNQKYRDNYDRTFRPKPVKAAKEKRDDDR